MIQAELSTNSLAKGWLNRQVSLQMMLKNIPTMKNFFGNICQCGMKQGIEIGMKLREGKFILNARIFPQSM